MKRKRHPLFKFLIIIIIVVASLFVIKNLNIMNRSNDNITGYNGKSLIAVDRDNNNIFISKNETEKHIPASLTKLFVIEYATSISSLDDIILVKPEVLSFVKKDSSIANLELKEYSILNIYAGMLVPSGNDASYVLAEYLGGRLDPSASNPGQRIEAFIKGLNDYLKSNKYFNTKIYDPSGYDFDARTTVLDIKKVLDNLLEYDWFREIVSQNYYIATLPDMSTQTWKNTNEFLNPESPYYNENIFGIKTGSLADDFNLVVLYKSNDKEYLICSMGSESDESRYEDVEYVIKSIE